MFSSHTPLTAVGFGLIQSESLRLYRETEIILKEVEENTGESQWLNRILVGGDLVFRALGDAIYRLTLFVINLLGSLFTLGLYERTFNNACFYGAQASLAFSIVGIAIANIFSPGSGEDYLDKMIDLSAKGLIFEVHARDLTFGAVLANVSRVVADALSEETRNAKFMETFRAVSTGDTSSLEPHIADIVRRAFPGAAGDEQEAM